VVICVLAVGYFLKGAKWFPNQAIPLTVINIGAALYTVLNLESPRPDMGKVEFLLRCVSTGWVISFAAWGFHATILKKVEGRSQGSSGWWNGEREDEEAPEVRGEK